MKPKERLQTTDKEFFCPECRRSNIHIAAWIDAHTGEETASDLPISKPWYCVDCDETFKNIDLTPSDGPISMTISTREEALGIIGEIYSLIGQHWIDGDIDDSWGLLMTNTNINYNIVFDEKPYFTLYATKYVDRKKEIDLDTDLRITEEITATGAKFIDAFNEAFGP